MLILMIMIMLLLILLAYAAAAYAAVDCAAAVDYWLRRYFKSNR